VGLDGNFCWWVNFQIPQALGIKKLLGSICKLRARPASCYNEAEKVSDSEYVVSIFVAAALADDICNDVVCEVSWEKCSASDGGHQEWRAEPQVRPRKI